MIVFTIKTSSEKAYNCFQKDTNIVIDKLIQYEDKIKIGMPVFLIFGGDGTPWENGLAGVCRIASNPMEVGYETAKNGNYYKLKIEKIVKFNRHFTKKDFLRYPETCDTGIGPSTKGERNQALGTIEDEKAISAICRAIIDAEMDKLEAMKEAFGDEMIARAMLNTVVYFEKEQKKVTVKTSKYSRNRLVIGAPGTGKSRNLKRDAENEFDKGNIERVTFHPAYTYAQFVGCYKPVMCSNDEGNDEISYEYVPGPFTRTYANAMLNYEKHWKGKNEGDDHDQRIFLLIIEELNRANAPAVFGDVFQLLDRDEKGNSEYPVKTSEDLRKYLKSVGIEKTDELCIPSNMYIWATMNSADQGVQPLDAAFKRRWDMEYVGLYDNTELDDCDIPASPEQDSDSWSTVKWVDFRRALNGYLLENFRNVHEDRCIGPFFIKGSVIANANDNGKGTEEFKNQFKNKLLMYLYEDIVKMNPGKLFKSGYKTYSDIREGFEKVGFGIFVEDIKFEIEDNDSENKSGDADDSNNADVLNNPSDGNP